MYIYILPGTKIRSFTQFTSSGDVSNLVCIPASGFPATGNLGFQSELKCLMPMPSRGGKQVSVKFAIFFIIDHCAQY